MPRPRIDSEDSLERETLALFAALGWQTALALHEWAGAASPLGRATPAEVVLTARLRPALARLNPTLPPAALDDAVEELRRDRSTLSLAAANRAVAQLLRDGVLVHVRDDAGEEITERVRVIDWQQPAHNDFLLVSQFWVSGEIYKRRADLVGFVNGLPLLFIELKAHHRRVEDAYMGNLRDYKATIPQLFWPNALIILSNGAESRVGSVTAGWDHFAAWKRINDEGEQGVISLETTVRATGTPTRLLDLVEHFTLFQEAPGGLRKLIGQNHQYLGVNNAVRAVGELGANQGRLGVFWHTQGSGKSFSMVFFAQKILRSVPGNWTFLIVTDRVELDDQIYKTFASVGAVTEDEQRVRAQDGGHLRQLLTEDHRYLFTLIQKFRTAGGAPFPTLSTRADIIVITDEAHRSQYDIFAQNLRRALPNAAFIGFTGTPLIRGEAQQTRAVFGDYISIYNFRQSVEDHATVPLFYENRIPDLQLTNADLNADLERVLDEAALDEAQERRLEREFAREYHLITRDERLETIAQDVVAHYMGRGDAGKAMFIAVDKATAVRMYDKVQQHWQAYLAALQAALPTASDGRRAELTQAIAFMQATDMAVVVSAAQNEAVDFAQRGLDIVPHRRRMVQEDLDSKFKDPADPLRIVFVCAMWITGFDVPSCATIYLDKPMRNHTLMQTIARANRVFGDKVNGLIVDYVGVFRNLQQALAIYGADAGGGVAVGDSPVRDKAALVDQLRQAVDAAAAFCAAHGVDLAALAGAATAYTRIAAVSAAVEALLVNDDHTQQYLGLAATVERLFRAILPDPAADTVGPPRAALAAVADRIRALTAPADISGVRDAVNSVLDQSIAPDTAYIIRGRAYRTLAEGPPQEDDGHLVDLSAIDFAALRQRFEQGRKRTEAERLRGAVNRTLTQMIRLNRTRMNYRDQFQRMIDDYNAGATSVDAFFAQLVGLAQRLSAEEQRAIAEQLSEEELALFDILVKPEVQPTPEETAQIKQVARALLQVLTREKLVLDWRKQQQARAAVRVAIEEQLDRLPEVYTTELYQQKCVAVYQHIYDSYFGQGRSVYAQAA